MREKRMCFSSNLCSGGRYTAMFCIYRPEVGETHGYLGDYWCYENVFGINNNGPPSNTMFL